MLAVEHAGFGCSCGRLHPPLLQRGDVALGQAELARLEQAAHDLPAARLRDALDELDLLGRDDRAEPRARACATQLPLELVRGLEAGLERDERLDDLAGDRVGLADHAGLGDRRVLEQDALDLERADQVADVLMTSSARPTNQK